MSTLAKNLKDSNGNVILPKTRSEQVYRPDNTSVETTLSSLSTKVDGVEAVDKSAIIYNCTHTKSGTVHQLSFTNLPTSATQNLLHLSFTATADFVAGDTFTVNGAEYSPLLSNMSAPPANIFKNGALVSMDINISTKKCFFKLGGGSTGPSEDNPPAADTYQKLIVFPSSSTWVVPETNWYQIFAIGTAANGSAGGGGSRGNFNYERNGTGGNGGAGGGGGGSAVSCLFLKKDTSIPITVTDSVSSFGSYLSATGGSGSVGGTANGGNVTNVNGSAGTSGTSYNGMSGGNGGKGGYTGSSKYRTGSVGSGGLRGVVIPSGSIYGYGGGPGTNATQWTGSSPLIGGGGGGGGGGDGIDWGISGSSSPRGGSGGSGGLGSKGCVVIEKSM